jgi:hypothetical protein
MAGRYDNPMLELNKSSVRVYDFGVCGIENAGEIPR